MFPEISYACLLPEPVQYVGCQEAMEKRKKETAKGGILKLEGRLPGKQGISPLPFLLHRSIQTCHFVQVVLGCWLLATTLVVRILQA